VAIVCGELELDREDPLAVTNPKLLVEVLSPSTEAYDRGEKWAHFRRIESIEAYILVSSTVPRVEIFERQLDGAFVLRLAQVGESLPIACLGGELAVEPLFRHAIA
jgi:Uma2 family endonuclease